MWISGGRSLFLSLFIVFVGSFIAFENTIRLSADRIRLLASALIVFANIIREIMIERTSSSDVSDSSNRAEVVFSVPSESFVLIREQTFFACTKKGCLLLRQPLKILWEMGIT